MAVALLEMIIWPHLLMMRVELKFKKGEKSNNSNNFYVEANLGFETCGPVLE